MMLAEIKAVLPHLTRQERCEILLAIAKLDASAQIPAGAAAIFSEAKDHVFQNYGELLRSLAGIEPRTVAGADLDVPRAVDAVFEKHCDLLRRLAE